MTDYNISDFTEKNYRYLLRVACTNNNITSYEDAIVKSEGTVWRHDIDFSVHRALSLSRIEKEEGIRAYYFVHLHSAFYNPLERCITDRLCEIQQNGGIIGLHFEPGYWNLRIEEKDRLVNRVELEKRILEELIGCQINHMSFHNPDIGGEWFALSEDKIAGLTNVYGKSVRRGFEYCSDSNGYWRYSRLEDVLLNSRGKKLHILTHPAWWQNSQMYPYDRIKRPVEGRMENVLGEYEKFLNANGRENITGQ